MPNSEATTIANTLYRGVVCRHGAPKILLSDRGPNLTGRIMSNLNKLLGIRHITTTPYHPQSNAKVERFHRTLNDALSQLVNKSHTNWDAHVDSVLFAYTTSVVESLQESPFFLIYGRDPALPTDAWIAAEEDKDSPLESMEALRLHKSNLLETFVRTYRQVHRLAKANKERAVEKFNANQKPVHFFAGDLVILWKPPRRTKNAEVDNSKKFAFRGHGPCRVIQVHDKDVYTVKHLFTQVVEKTNASKMTLYRPWKNKIPDLQDHWDSVEKTNEAFNPNLASHENTVPNLLNMFRDDAQLGIPVKLLSERARLPSRGSSQSAGLDLYSPQPGEIPVDQRQLLKLDIQVEIPNDCYGRIAPRSSLASKGIDIAAGVVDSDYRGNVGVILVNNGSQPYIYRAGDKVAQLIIEKIKIMPCRQVSNLTETERGACGFGSTGL